MSEAYELAKEIDGQRDTIYTFARALGIDPCDWGPSNAEAATALIQAVMSVLNGTSEYKTMDEWGYNITGEDHSLVGPIFKLRADKETAEARVKELEECLGKADLPGMNDVLEHNTSLCVERDALRARVAELEAEKTGRE